ncbi:DNA methyltransferase [Mycobacterium phage PattyP]|uniref:DNA methyltransferase n=1 Tax=Mycobacterium phage PattyP TaxID=1327773 RepID=UPI00032B3BE8|nr:DNA methyltransferase [Mycobacterium phage PattyP]AGK87348.1 DNA methylase [Mycobacterium phage PattyP]
MSNVDLRLGDCRDILTELEDASVDAIVTDPPYGLEFMGKDWDSPWKSGNGFRRAHNDADTGRNNVFGRQSRCAPEYFAGAAFQEWSTQWASECLRVLKPGGHLLAFGGPRTWHRLAAAIEDAGFEVRDSIAWLYGSGFPKSLDVSKAIDKAAGAEREVRQWQGWGTTLKPAFEPIVVARKPLVGTVAANVLEHGTGALNIDACRIGTAQGRWPTNVVLDDTQAAELGEPQRFFPVFKYQAKAPTKERPSYVNEDGAKVAHSTVKPLTLMRWLARLVCPPGGVILDPFAGSGTTVEACLLEGFDCIAIENEADYIPLIEHRISRSTT